MEKRKDFRLCFSSHPWLGWLGCSLALLVGSSVSFAVFGTMFTNAVGGGAFYLWLAVGVVAGALLGLLLPRLFRVDAVSVATSYSVPYWLLFVFWLAGDNGIIFAICGLTYCAATSLACWFCGRLGVGMRTDIRPLQHGDNQPADGE